VLFDCFRDFFECATFGLCSFGVFFEVVCLKGRLLLVPFHVVDSKSPQKRTHALNIPLKGTMLFQGASFFEL